MRSSASSREDKGLVGWNKISNYEAQRKEEETDLGMMTGSASAMVPLPHSYWMDDHTTVRLNLVVSPASLLFDIASGGIVVSGSAVDMVNSQYE